MRWLGVSTKVFSVGNYRRDRFGSMPNSWFDPNNKSAKAERVKIANDCLEDLIKWVMVDGGQVAVYDANSESVERRQYIFDRLNEEQIHPVFIGNGPSILFSSDSCYSTVPQYCNSFTSRIYL